MIVCYNWYTYIIFYTLTQGSIAKPNGKIRVFEKYLDCFPKAPNQNDSWIFCLVWTTGVMVLCVDCIDRWFCADNTPAMAITYHRKTLRWDEWVDLLADILYTKSSPGEGQITLSLDVPGGQCSSRGPCKALPSTLYSAFNEARFNIEFGVLGEGERCDILGLCCGQSSHAPNYIMSLDAEMHT